MRRARSREPHADAELPCAARLLRAEHEGTGVAAVRREQEARPRHGVPPAPHHDPHGAGAAARAGAAPDGDPHAAAGEPPRGQRGLRGCAVGAGTSGAGTSGAAPPAGGGVAGAVLAMLTIAAFDGTPSASTRNT